VYGVTDRDHADAATDAARAALDAAGLDGDVVVARPRNRSASVNGKERA
jgi:beta-ribofuranosylaminobenzene 5'-phosphate synthase